MQRRKVSIVNYLNSAPFVLGLNRAAGLDLEIHLDHPAESARKLLDGEVDIALAPVAIIPQMENASIISDYCIGCDGPVKTVKLFSEVPVREIKRIYLDYQSETSVRLTKVLCSHYWNIQPELVQAYPGFQKDIYGSNAGLIIGDRAIRVLGKYSIEIDLGEEWKKWTELPFVFAVWLSNHEIDAEWIGRFNEALAEGLKHREEIISKYSHLNNEYFSVNEYLHESIDYHFDPKKQKALDRFLQLIEAA